MSAALDALPPYLKKYSSEQRYESYTPQDHAAWRYIMRQNRAFFSRHAVPIYLEGLKRTGIPLDRIPRISEMDEHLAQFGWGAVPVTGFIPPAAFLEFQARSVLPIACDMRTVSHIAYTPAPDIVHEAAGHAPILAEPSYATYLGRYAKMAQKAIASREDIQLYEAIRYLSDIKENPDTRPEEIYRAEERLVAATKAITHVSEAAKVARMAWWTVEYGLVGDERKPRIYGAGLLSSVGESQNCLSERVRKIPLSVACVEQSYDITEPQPQLFVARDMKHLVEVLRDLEKTLAFSIGGAEAMRRAKRAETINTVVLDSGLEISGPLTEFEAPAETVTFFKLSGPVQLAHAGRELSGHGRSRHGEGFSSPVGPWIGADRSPSMLDDAALVRLGVKRGERATIRFRGGQEVRGQVTDWLRADGKLVLVTFRDCTVVHGDKKLFDPSWGEFDLAVGEQVVSVYGGPADIDHFGDYAIGAATTTPARKTPFSAAELRTFETYRELRRLRNERPAELEAKLAPLARRIVTETPNEWLLMLEVAELVHQRSKRPVAELPWAQDIFDHLATLQKGAPLPTPELIAKGLALAKQAD